MTDRYIALDIGEKRIVVATADTVKIAVPQNAIAMNEISFVDDIIKLIDLYKSTRVIVGYPRNQSGDSTPQSDYTLSKVQALRAAQLTVETQDESLSSVIAKERLGDVSRAKGIIDSEAAAVILQDYLESRV